MPKLTPEEEKEFSEATAWLLKNRGQQRSTKLGRDGWEEWSLSVEGAKPETFRFDSLQDGERGRCFIRAVRALRSQLERNAGGSP